MGGSCRLEDVGKTGFCKLCGNPFTMGRTFTLCSHCSFVADTKNYSLLNKEEKHLRQLHQRSCRRTYVRDISEVLTYNREWRNRNPSKRYLQRQRGVDRYTEETLEFAENYYLPWDPSEVAYLKGVSQTKTAREIAIDLGRTYCSIISRAWKEKIPLMTEDKRHGRLVTGR